MQDFCEFCDRDGLTLAYAPEHSHRGIRSNRAALVEAPNKTFAAAETLAPGAEVIANKLLSRACLRPAA